MLREGKFCLRPCTWLSKLTLSFSKLRATLTLPSCSQGPEALWTSSPSENSSVQELCRDIYGQPLPKGCRASDEILSPRNVWMWVPVYLTGPPCGAVCDWIIPRKVFGKKKKKESVWRTLECREQGVADWVRYCCIQLGDFQAGLMTQ